MPPSDAKKTQSKGRLEKWAKMVQCGLDEEFANKVFNKKNVKNSETIGFSKYARIGLNNFLEQNPRLFMSRLSKGPPA